MNSSNVTAWICSLGLLLAASVQAEDAWIRFDPERPGYAATPPSTNGWQVIDQFGFAAPEPGSALALLEFGGPLGPGTLALVQDVVEETIFDYVEVVLHVGGTQTRLLLERVRVAELHIHADLQQGTPRADRVLSFEAITFIYEPEAEDVVGAYSEVDMATGGGTAGDYVPRDPEIDPVFGATLTRDPTAPNGLALSWESEPGVQYDVEFSDDLTDPESWEPLSVGQVFGGEGRRSTITVTEPRGFYRIRER